MGDRPALVFTCFSPALTAASRRCGSRLVGRGDAIGDVYAHCGEPMYRETSVDYVTYRVTPEVAVTHEVAVEH